MIAENAHMQKRMARKSARGGRALLPGVVRCGRCGRMMRVFYGMRYAVEAALRAVAQAKRADHDVRLALERELEEARYEASLATRRYEAVDPTKRLVARELEARWNISLEHVAQLEERISRLDASVTSRPEIDQAALMALAHDLPAAWNAPSTDARTKQRLTRILIEEVVIDLDDASNEAVVTIHWKGGRHTEIRVARVRCGRYPADRHPSPVEVLRKLGGRWPDRQLAVTMNRMRCKSADGQSWTTVRVRELRERLGIAAFDRAASRIETISVYWGALAFLAEQRDLLNNLLRRHG